MIPGHSLRRPARPPGGLGASRGHVQELRRAREPEAMAIDGGDRNTDYRDVGIWMDMIYRDL